MKALRLLALAVGCAGPALAQPVAGDLAPPGAAACSGCHAPPRAGLPTTIPPIHGRDAGEIVTAMQDYRAGRRPATVMDRLARGFSDEEIQAMAGWLSRQR